MKATSLNSNTWEYVLHCPPNSFLKIAHNLLQCNFFNRLAELTLRYSDDSAKLSCHLGQKKTKKRPGRVGLAELVLVELSTHRLL